MSNPLIYLVAGEASGDALGADLMRALRAQKPEIQFAGIGGEAMKTQGLTSLFAYSELSIMGFLEVLPHIPQLLKRMRETEQDIAAKNPGAVVTIDSPGFNFRLAQRLRKNPKTRHIKLVHYVAPSVWAYKPGRARKIAKWFDALLALLPFEPPYFEKEGLATTFVGHPVIWNEQKGDAKAFRARHNIEPHVPLLLILPGSRRGEIDYHLDIFMEAVRPLRGFIHVILASPQVKELIVSKVPRNVVIADMDEKYDAFAASTMALTKSGTISLELAVAGVPMVVAHRSHPLSAWLIRHMIRIPYVSLINIAANAPIIAELLQEHCNIKEITQALLKLASPETREVPRNQYTRALAILRGKNTNPPGELAAKAILAIS